LWQGLQQAGRSVDDGFTGDAEVGEEVPVVFKVSRAVSVGFAGEMGGVDGDGAVLFDDGGDVDGVRRHGELASG